ncbi:hypothetical protein GCM10010433_38520 [Streptomyces pulveraceus]
MRRIGIIGGGEIGRTIVTGLYDASGASPEAEREAEAEVFLSPGEPARPQNCPSAARTYGSAPTTMRWWTAPSW